VKGLQKSASGFPTYINVKRKLNDDLPELVIEFVNLARIPITLGNV
jgi:hypothetical protein